ncbi:MAG: type II secretion system protein GspE [Planctomycetes bacterium HGW-Planctomycetes-1]|nr:MAG: type II secretion system protein GspE [Planctomycetes bacterium HGW-Planctomycetes-1]
MPKLDTENSLFDEIIRLGIADEPKLTSLYEECAKSGRNIITVLKENGLLTDEQFGILIAKSQNIEFLNLSPDKVEPIAAHMIPYELSNEHNLIGVRMEGDKLYVAMSSPMDLAIRDQIEMRTGCRVIPQAAAPNAIKSSIRYHFNVQNVTKQTIASMRLKKTTELEKQRPTAILDQLQESEDPVSSLVASIIAGAIDSRVSDIHIEPQEKDMIIRYRIDGVLRKELNIPSSAQAEILSHIKILAKMDIAEKRLPQDGHITTVHQNKEYDLRVSSLPSIVGEKIVIRILDKTGSKWNIDNITPDSRDNEGMRKLVENPYGMILLTGPTGSGKTTTLYSLLQLLNNGRRNIITVEDPVEYRLDGITQVQTNAKAGLTFASALRSILRQDPDVILIGEIRDPETAEIAVSAAMTGHLVLSTLHTNDAAGALSRLINLDVPPFMLASSLLGAIAQRLVRTSCFACKEAYKPEPEIRTRLFPNEPEDMVLYRGSGCDNCSKTGYLGRRGLYEILPVTNTIQNMIIEGKSDTEIKRQAIKEGMRTLKQSGLQQVLSGSTTLDELYRVVDMQEE